MAAVVVGFCAFGLGRAMASAPESTPSAVSVVVQPGETLWAIAQRAMPQVDPRDAVDRLAALNHISADALQVGQTLRLR